MKTNKSQLISHGEFLLASCVIPSNAVEVPQKESSIIVAPSETTGNHHILDLPQGGVQILETPDKRRFVRNSIPTTVRCVLEHRHDTKVVPPGEWEMGIHQEFDYISQQKKNVVD